MSRPSDNTRARSRGSSYVPSETNASDIYDDEQQGTFLPIVKSKGKQAKQQTSLDLAIHPFYEMGNPSHPMPSMVPNFDDYARLMREPHALRRWYEFIAKIISYDRILFNQHTKLNKEHTDLNQKYKDLTESYNDMDKKYKRNTAARRRMKKAYEESQSELQTTQEELAQTKLELELVNKALQQRPTGNADSVTLTKQQNQREENASLITNVQTKKEEIVFNWKVRGTDPPKKLTEK